MSKRQDQSLIRDYLKGERDAARQIESHIQRAFSVWRHKFGYEIDDILSDVRYKLLICLRNNEFNFQSSLATYISRIISHTSIDYLRLQRRFEKINISEIPLPDHNPTPEQQLESNQLKRINFRVIRLISGDCRKLWRMYLKERLNCREIGERWGKTEGNIRRRLWACRKQAKELREKILKKDKQL